MVDHSAWDPPKPVTEDIKPRCVNCNRLLAEWLTRPWSIKCSRCKANNTGVLVKEGPPTPRLSGIQDYR